MAGEWREVPIGELAEIYDGPHATPPKTDDGPVFLGISNLASGRIDLTNAEHLSEDDYARWTRRVEPLEGDVVFSYETRLGEAAIIPHGLRCCLGRRMGLLRARPGKVDKRFLLYAYLGPQFQKTLRSRTIHGSTVDRIPLIEMPRFTIEVPASIDEQQAIAHILGTLDDKIELNRRMSETLEAMARALFKSWFVDFDPVRAKAEGRDPGLPAPLADLFPARLVDSELGEIPEGWEVKPISELADVVGGSTPKTERAEYWEGGTHYWVTPKDLSALSMPVLLDTERKITDAGLAQISSGLLPKGTVLLSSRAPIGYLAIAEVPVAVNQGFIAMKPRRGTSNLFLLRWARAFHEEIVSHANGSTFLEISRSSFRLIRTVAPTASVMDAFDRISQPLYRKVVEHERESRTLAALRDALLPRLISGALRVNDAERFLEARGL
ncbi:restriction endonuclease subunit S [Sinimarinibacterium thermocellulolyticum]|uniref:Restriction endonuclease subunit S n=1 Tax=Sinimarinibacterium thermocellulolyticum TaxID=3170016 RepID=A0ABV2A8S9_9GAMM